MEDYNLEVDHCTVSDWLNMHGVDAEAVKVTLRTLDTLGNPDQLCAFSRNREELDLNAEEAWRLASQALQHSMPKLSEAICCIAHDCERNFQAPEGNRPYTFYRGPDKGPFISMHYNKLPEDVMCVAHEFGHALQYHISQGRTIPPVVREIAAFVAEEALLEFVKYRLPEMHLRLYKAWEEDNKTYFGRDLEQLYSALCSSRSQYCYEINYPMGRLIANRVYKDATKPSVMNIFRGTISLSAFLSFIKEKNGAIKMINHLPEIPKSENDPPAIVAYRSVGIMVLLDIDSRRGECENSICQYYSERLYHLQSKTAFIATNDERKPIGYALWNVDKNDPTLIHLQRQAAPFGNHLELQKKLQALLPAGMQVASYQL